ncbi:MAG: hypothetical protein J6N51_09115, partial [Selenomonas sp.]|nr:hypothetical protein [Selenomonas sp.]
MKKAIVLAIAALSCCTWGEAAEPYDMTAIELGQDKPAAAEPAVNAPAEGVAGPVRLSLAES